MDKQEFLDKLRAALNGRIPTIMVTENVNYYNDYINTEIRKGRSMEEVMEALGDPRLIAKTIIQTQSGAGGFSAQSSEYREFYEDSENGTYTYQDERGTFDRGTYAGQNGYEARGFMNRFRKNRFTKIPGWLGSLIGIFVTILIFIIVFKAIAFLAPLLIILGVVMLMVKIFRDWLN